jgi:hypothetical protein
VLLPRYFGVCRAMLATDIFSAVDRSPTDLFLRAMSKAHIHLAFLGRQLRFRLAPGFSLTVLAAFVLCLARPALAQQQPGPETAAGPSVLYPRLFIGLGGFVAFFDTNLRVDSEELGIGTEIDLEKDLGFNNRKLDFRGLGYYRLGRRHRLTFGYFTMSRNSTATIDEDIQFGDTVFPIDTDVEAYFRTSFANLGYRFSFLAHDKVEAAVGLALSAMITRSGISAVGSVGEEPVDVGQETKDVTLPIANLNLGATWNPVSRLVIAASAGGLYVKVSDVEASVGEIFAGANYYLLRNLGIGVGYNWVKLGAEKTSGTSVDVTYRYSGLLVYAIGAF